MDAERCRRELLRLEDRALSLPAGITTHVSGGDHDGMARRVSAMVDREAQLHARIEQDYDLIDMGCEVLYGKDQDGLGGLCSMAPGWWADAIYHRYLGCRTWPAVAELLGFSKEHLCRTCQAAFDLMDANGMAATVSGVGMAEGV